MDDININSSNLDEQIISCYQKYIDEEVQKGFGVLPHTVLDKSIDLIYAYWITLERSDLMAAGPVAILVYNYYFEK